MLLLITLWSLLALVLPDQSLLKSKALHGKDMGGHLTKPICQDEVAIPPCQQPESGAKQEPGQTETGQRA